MNEAYVLTTMSIAILGIIVILAGPLAQLRREEFWGDIQKTSDELFESVGQTRCGDNICHAAPRGIGRRAVTASRKEA